ncbi:MAG: hypothetical protein WHV66_04635 [Anaerolineales bacterium]
MNKNRAFLFFLILITLESVPSVLLLDWNPSEPQSALFLGYSAQRLTAIAFTLFLCAGLALLTFKAILYPSWWAKIISMVDNTLLDKRHFLNIFLSTAFLFVFSSGLLFLLNSRIAERFGMLQLVYQRFQGLTIWLVVLFGQVLVLLYFTYQFNFQHGYFYPSDIWITAIRNCLRLAAAVFILFYLLARYFSLRVFYVFFDLSLVVLALSYLSLWLYDKHRQKTWHHQTSIYLTGFILFFLAFMSYRLVTIYTGFPNTPGKAYFNLLADAWLQGRLYLTKPDQIHDLTFYQGQWYVPNPPLVAVLMVPWVAWKGVDSLNTVIFSLLFAALNVALMYWILEALADRGWSALRTRDNLWLIFLFTFGTAHFYTSLIGKMWFLSNMVSITCMALAVLATLKIRSAWLAGACLALAVIARPNLALLFPFLLGITFQIEKDTTGKVAWRKMVIWSVKCALPMIIAVGGLLLYNLARFDNLFDFGYLTENVAGFMAEDLKQYGTFHPHFILRNLKVMLFNLPRWDDDCNSIAPSVEGMSMFITTPAFIYLFRRFQRKPWFIGAWVAVGMIVGSLMLSYNTGAWQFGYKYTLDFLIPMMSILAVSVGNRVPNTMKILILTSVAINWLGVLWWFGLYCG